MFDKPPHATRHCRFYSYERGDGVNLFGEGSGPRCAGGIKIDGRGESAKCMPPGVTFGDRSTEPCAFREEYTDAERAAWEAWRNASAARMVIVLAAIPGKARDRSNWGSQGELDCPGCLVGKVRWVRARSNGHIHAACSTPNCFAVIE